MIIAISLFAASFLIMMGMIYMKSVEINTGRAFFFSNQKLNHVFEKSHVLMRRYLRHWNWKTANLLYHFALERVENFFLSIFRYFRNKFSHQVNMVKGQGNLDQDKNSSSFFLKNIDERKDSSKD